MFGTSTKKTKRQVRTFENPVESWRDFLGNVGEGAKQEAKTWTQDALTQIAALEKDVQKLSGEIKAGESIDLVGMEQKQVQEPSYPEAKAYTQPGLDYHREFNTIREVRIVKEDTRQIQIRIDQIVVELRKLTSSSQELAVEFEEVTMEQTPPDAGTYHLNFFEWVFSVIQKARERIDESQTWLRMFKSKKGQRNYWNMFKKHGTTFGLSGERVVATQTG